MCKALFLFLLFTLASALPFKAQYIYYKNPSPEYISQFKDSANRLLFVNNDSTDILKSQFAYILKFYPKMLVKNIRVTYKKAPYVAKVRPAFPSIFKAPQQRQYNVTFSTGTHSTLDSVLLKNLSFNSQLALVAHQVSSIEDLSTGGFFNFIGFYLNQLTHKGKKRIYLDAEEKTLEVGLGFQLLTFNQEFHDRLLIDNWQSTKGYDYYMKHYKNMPMKSQFILNFLSDLPVYMTNVFK